MTSRQGIFQVDFLLRQNGFKIHFREHRKEPIWERDGHLYPQSQAIKLVDWGELKDALLAEEDYYDGLFL